MTKLKTIILVLAMLIGTQAIANIAQTKSIDEQKEINQNTVKQLGVVSTDNENNLVDKSALLSERYLNNLKECKPLHFHQFMDIFGFKLGFKIDINGWVEDKCSYNITGSIDAIGKDIREVYNVKASDEQFAAIKPEVKCGFTKEQLSLLIDVMMARREQKVSEKVLGVKKSENSSLTPDEEKLLAMFMEDKVCTIPNMETLKQQFMELMDTETPDL